MEIYGIQKSLKVIFIFFHKDNLLLLNRMAWWLVLPVLLIVLLNPEYAEHTWKEITADGRFTNHNSNGDSLYGADISTHPKHRHEGIGGMLYEARKDLVIKLNLRRMIAGGRLFNYSEYAEKMSAQEYAGKVMKGEVKDPVLSFELDNGFRFVKILPNYLDDVRSLNYASFIEWLNPRYQQKY